MYSTPGMGPLNGYPAPPETSSKVGQASSSGPGESAPSNFTSYPSQRRITEAQRPRAVALSGSLRTPWRRGSAWALFCDLKRSTAALLPPSNPCLGILDCSNPGPMMPSRKPAPTKYAVRRVQAKPSPQCRNCMGPAGNEPVNLVGCENRRYDCQRGQVGAVDQQPGEHRKERPADGTHQVGQRAPSDLAQTAAGADCPGAIEPSPVPRRRFRWRGPFMWRAADR